MERLFREGRRSSSYLLTVLSVDGACAEGRGRCAFIAGKKLGPAPLRNRCKRVMRECARELEAPWVGHDVAFVARRKIATAPHENVVKAMKKQLADLGVVENG